MSDPFDYLMEQVREANIGWQDPIEVEDLIYDYVRYGEIDQLDYQILMRELI